MKQAILLSLLLGACAHSVHAKPILNSHDIIVYRGDDAPTYRVHNDQKICWLERGEYFKTKTRKLGVDSPFMQGSKSMAIIEGGYYKIDAADYNSWFLHRYAITKVPDDIAKKEISGQTEVCK